MVPIARFDRAILYAMHVHGGPAGMTGLGQEEKFERNPVALGRSALVSPLSGNDAA